MTGRLLVPVDAYMLLERDGKLLMLRRALAVDWVPSRPERPEGVVVVYEGGVLPAADIDAIVLGEGNLPDSLSPSRARWPAW